MATTDTKSISKTGDIITVVMADDFEFKIDTSVEPHVITDLADVAITLSATRQEQADMVCATMCQIKA